MCKVKASNTNALNGDGLLGVTSLGLFSHSANSASLYPSITDEKVVDMREFVKSKAVQLELPLQGFRESNVRRMLRKVKRKVKHMRNRFMVALKKEAQYKVKRYIDNQKEWI